eukprot:CAMPEP_0114695276 /NCGR_PEP_ID=MMETSP0191-20121206/71191_1 /TAXON_ID=126664 /ORGANISM="Sorites sp." /LENGTH=39 /DNA_ID= /DNA_START= /DNA_END= /DNA_ORIENTATION=
MVSAMLLDQDSRQVEYPARDPFFELSSKVDYLKDTERPK